MANLNTGNTEVKALKATSTHPHYTRCVTSPKKQLIIQNVCEQCGCIAVTIVISFSFPDHSLASPHACLREKRAPTQPCAPVRVTEIKLSYQLYSIKSFKLQLFFPPPHHFCMRS